MGTTVIVPVEEYLSTSYSDGDREYLDGEVVERNVGEFNHSDVQSAILNYLRNHYKPYWCVVECRTRITRTRYRIPDVCLGISARPGGGPLQDPPFLAVEVLSPDDRAADMDDKISDYLSCGVKFVWVINPKTQRATIHTSEASHQVKDGILRTENPTIEVPLSAIFE
jgi:Uma2 family endonuclease